MVIELDNLVRGGEPYLRTRGMFVSRIVNMARRPRGSFIVIPIAVSGMATPENKVTRWSLSSIKKKIIIGTRRPSPSYEQFLEGRSSPFMQLAGHAQTEYIPPSRNTLFLVYNMLVAGGIVIPPQSHTASTSDFMVREERLHSRQSF